MMQANELYYGSHVSLGGQATDITKTITNLFILLCHYRMRLADWLNEGRWGQHNGSHQQIHQVEEAKTQDHRLHER